MGSIRLKRGHGVIGATRSDTEETLADIFSFMLWQLGEPGFQPVMQN